MPLPSHTPAWQALQQQAEHIRPRHLAEFGQNAQRFETFSWQQGDLLLDLSKQRLDQATLQHLIRLAEACNLPAAIQALISGQPVNTSEQRPALHTALRLPSGAALWLDGQDINLAVQASLTRMAQLVERLHAGQWRGVTGKPITDVMNLGVGGSDLGPMMVCHALAEHQPQGITPVRLHFASTIDGSQLAERLKQLDPATTLFIVSSKSFTTIDTLSNAATARHWLMERLGNEALVLKQHFIGVSAQPQKMSEWGIHPDNQLLFWDWVGGRYSFWSVIGLPIALQIGMQGFRELLAGAHRMDRHFAQAPLDRNLPVLLALAGIWNVNFLNIRTQAVLPYDGRLKFLPNYLSQLEMESNGKRTTHAGDSVDYATCPVLWGELGPNAQHAFYQLLHQGTEGVNCDFIAPIRRYDDIQEPTSRAYFKHQHRLALANCLAQSRLLMLGDAAVNAEDQYNQPACKRYQGNQPSTTLLLQALTPSSLGQLIALYEHKVYVQAVIWDINPFDQWGVELGKKLALSTEPMLAGKIPPADNLDPSTRGLLQACLNTEG